MCRKDLDVLDTPVLQLSDTDVLDVKTLCEGLIITGSPGAGKSSCSGRQVAEGLLRVPNMGGLILTAKAEETRSWIERIEKCGRTDDLILFNLDSGHCYDPLHYERTRSGRGSSDPENIIEIFAALSSNGKKESVQGDGLFFERANDQLMRNAIVLLDLAKEPISIATIDRVINSLPTFPEQHEIPEWQKDAFCAQLVNQVRLRQNAMTQDEWVNLEAVAEQLFKRWPETDARPRSSVAATWSGTADRFLLNPYRRLFSSGVCSLTPEMTTHENKLVLCDFPMLEVGFAMGRMINTLLKVCFQRAWLRRDLAESANPVFCWTDEAQYFLTKQDNFFQQTCRGSRVVNVLLTQNILNISEEFAENQPGSRTKSLLGNIGTKIFHQQNDVETCLYAADQIGKEYRYISNFNAGSGGESGSAHTSIGGSLQLAHIVEPIAFTRLQKPDNHSPLAAAIVYSGSPFNATRTKGNPSGSNHLKVHFSR